MNKNKKKDLIIIALILLIIIYLVINYKDILSEKEEIVLIIDAGHGGNESGALSPSGIREKDINLAIVKKMAEELKGKYKIILTRDSDYYISIKKRVEIAEQSNADFIISIHQNSYEGNCSKGGSEFYQNNKELRSLGFSIQDSLNKELNFTKRKEQKPPKPFGIFKTDIPTMLFEVNFICNEDIAHLLNNSENQEKIAQIMANEISSYLDKKYPNQIMKQPLQTKDILDNNTIIAIYGRSFNVAPENNSNLRDTIGRLGSLGFYANFDDFWNGILIEDVKEKSTEEITPIQELTKKFDSLNEEKGAIPAIDIVVYSPTCWEMNNSFIWYSNNLNYILNKYAKTNVAYSIIEPTLEKNVLVFIDHQLGNQSVEVSMQEIINDKYLEYPNAHIAFDPEWHVYPDEKRCNTPKYNTIGSIDAGDINNALIVLNNYLKETGTSREIIVIFHHFMEEKVLVDMAMIHNKSQIKNPNSDQIKIVFDADSIGDQCTRVLRYNSINNQDYQKIAYPAIKYFPDFNPYRTIKKDLDDSRPLNELQLLGKQKTSIYCKENQLIKEPSIIIRN